MVQFDYQSNLLIILHALRFVFELLHICDSTRNRCLCCFDKSVESSQTYQEKLSTFAGLSHDTQTVGYALAFSPAPLRKTPMVEKLVKGGFLTWKGKRFYVKNVAAAFNELEKHDLAERSNSGDWKLAHQIDHHLVHQLANRPEKLEKFARAFHFAISSYYSVAANGLYRSYYYSGVEAEGPIHFRTAVYLGKPNQILELYDNLQNASPKLRLFEFLAHPFDPKQFDRLPKELTNLALIEVVDACARDLRSPGDLFELALEAANHSAVLQTLGEIHLCRGEWSNFDEILKLLSKDHSNEAAVSALELEASRQLLKGDASAAVEVFERSFAVRRKISRKKKFCPPGLSGVWLVLALLKLNQPKTLTRAANHTKWALELGNSQSGSMHNLHVFAEVLGGNQVESTRATCVAQGSKWAKEPEPILVNLTLAILCFHLVEDRAALKGMGVMLDRLATKAHHGGYAWVAAEAASLRDAMAEKPTAKQKAQTKAFWEPFGAKFDPISTAFEPIESWEVSLKGFEMLAAERAGKSKSKKKVGKKGEARKELVWILTTDEDGRWWALQPMERSVSATGRTTKGRNVALRRLKLNNAEMTHLTEQDRKAAQRIRSVQTWRGEEFAIESPKILLDLTGHPFIYADAEQTKPIDLVKTLPRLDISDTNSGDVKLRLTPDLDYSRPEPELVKESESQVLVVDVRKVHVQVFALLGYGEATFPVKAKERVLKALGELSAEFTIEADEAAADIGAKTVPAETRPVLRLLPHGEGLHAQLMARPIEGSELNYAPGEGKAVVFAACGGENVQTTRDLKSETVAAESVVTVCPTFAAFHQRNAGGWTALLDESVSCLELLVELHALTDEQVRVEWPEGQSYRLSGVADTSQFQISLGGSASDWLTASGELKVDEELVLSMRQLLEFNQLAATSPTPGFVQLEDGGFLALTKEFRRQLDDLEAFSQPGKGDKVKVHPLAALALGDLAQNAKAKVSKAWKDQLAKLQEAPTLELDLAPSTLRAELRPYQMDGYRWLRQLAGWKMGACLADDMGLGKTIQTLALLLDRATDGPALVVAPTSVAANWLEETVRFAPTLNPIPFGGSKRRKILENAGPFDLVIASYGLLQSEADSFGEVEWNTVVLDEAQAIKNRETKRSRAAMQLKADLRLVTTGTPIENRLAELHNLFNFINPGFLGSWERFRAVFADPIERDRKAEPRDRLRRLIRPFILRRLKSDVLKDLPSRTEVSLTVEMSKDEAAFYEAMRQKAIDEVDAAGASDEPGHKAIEILAQLTKLRRAACHPRLIDKESELESSKLRVFGETLTDILAGDHKVLVFSQFVSHLALIREYLDTEKVSYQYLDGSTPAKKRQKAVHAFQGGEGDVFLISLKAGGFGLNLTAADYVIHMDPWWNPAAEDQASDRAHRIGQKRPVTIYRLITQGSIEEKIVALHQQKRELADSLLEGTDAASRLSPEELLALLRE